MFYLFKSRNPFQKLFLSTVFAIGKYILKFFFYIYINFGSKGHQYIIHHIFSVYNENPNEEAIKILIVLVEVGCASKRNILYRITNTIKKKSGYLKSGSLE